MYLSKRRGMRRVPEMQRIRVICQIRQKHREYGMWMDGSFTIEASLILPFVLLLLFGLMGLLFSLRDQVILHGEVLRICARGMQDGQDGLNDRENQNAQGSVRTLSEQFEDSLRKRMWRLQVEQGTVKVRPGKVTVTARLGRHGKQYSHRMSLGRRKPSTVRRYIGGEGEHRDDS